MEMDALTYKVESGIQLLARLTKKPNIEQFYPHLFPFGLKCGDIIEICSDTSMAHLLIDLLCEALMPCSLQGPQMTTLIFNMDANLDFEYFMSCLKNKICNRVSLKSHETIDSSDHYVQTVLKDTLKNLFVLNVYDATQFYTSLHKIESILMEHSNISLIIIDTLTAFYWSEQGFKITKLDAYIKNLIQIIQKITKDYKITIVYTKPISSKDIAHNETCSEYLSSDKPKYKIQLTNNDTFYEVIIRTFDSVVKNHFNILDNQIDWI